MGVYENTVDGLFTNYVVPQANGNHMDCKWVSLTNDRGMGMMVDGKRLTSVHLSMKKKTWMMQTLPAIW